jgi:starch synthase
VKSLAEFQSASGTPTAIIMPLYRQVHAVAPNLEPVGDPFTVQLGPYREEARLMQITPRPPLARTGSPRVYFVDHPHFFDRAGLYGENGYDYPDNPRRYAFFSLAALLALPRIAPERAGDSARPRLACGAGVGVPAHLLHGRPVLPADPHGAVGA